MIEKVEDLYRVDGKLNVAIIRQPWFQETQVYNNIMQATHFLGANTPFKVRLWCYTHNIVNQPKCVVCGADATFLPKEGAGYSETCSKPKCKSSHSAHKGIATKVKRYGVKVGPAAIEAARKRAQAGELYEKGRKTMLSRYGVSSPSQLPHYHQKRTKTILSRYGTTRVSEFNDSYANRWVAEMQSVTTTGIVRDVKRRTDDNRQLFDVTYQCNTCGDTSVIHRETFTWRVNNSYDPCPVCSPLGGSLAQKALYEYVASYVGVEQVKFNDKTILPDRLELDVVIPSKRLAFEFDGLFWHSFNRVETSSERKKHLNKTLLCEQIGYQLIHVFEHEWTHKRDIVLSRIRNLVGQSDKVFARKCEIRELSNSEARTFFDQTHIQGHANAKITFGLYYSGNLVAAMSFAPSRYNKNYQYEIVRYSTMLNCTVIGGASKLFKRFIKAYSPTSIISYADRRWSMGGMYKTLGFTLIGQTSPSYYYFKSEDGIKLHNRISFQKHKLAGKLKNYNPSLTESENMFNHGYRRIWDCGTLSFGWTCGNVVAADT